MTNNRILYHILFWIFIFFSVFDYHFFEYETQDAVFLTLLELLFNAMVVYANLYVLIPRVLQKRGVFMYGASLVVLLLVIYIPYYYFELGYYLIGDTELQIIISFTLNYILYIIVSFLYWYLLLYRKEKKKSILLENEKLQAELQLLKSQVSPHFLFNSLNNIYSLSLAQDKNAPLMIEKLSDILRYIIYESDKPSVPLEREIELIENYFELQLLKKPKAQKNIHLSLIGSSQGLTITPLLLVNLVENCFKHGDIGFNSNGFLKVDIKIDGNRFLFSTENSCRERPKRKGIGLSNVKEQLNHFYPGNHDITVEDNITTFKVVLTINL